MAAEDDRRGCVTLAGTGVRQYCDIGIAEAFCVKRVEDAEPTRFFVITPVMAFSVGKVFLQPGQHGGQRAGMQNVLAAQ